MLKYKKFITQIVSSKGLIVQEHTIDLTELQQYKDNKNYYINIVTFNPNILCFNLCDEETSANVLNLGYFGSNKLIHCCATTINYDEDVYLVRMSSC